MTYRSRKKTFKVIANLLVVMLTLSMFGVFSPSALATVVTYTIKTPNSADTYISERAGRQAFNYGGDVDMRTVSRATRNGKALLSFVTSSIPAGAKVETATVNLNNGRSDGIVPNPTVDIFRMLQAWVEGTDAGVASTGGASWYEYQLGDNAWTGTPPDWTVAGTGVGDFVATPTDSIAVDPVGWYAWNVTADVQGFVDGTYVNNGWILKHTLIDNLLQPGPRFDTRENGVPANDPYLLLAYIMGDTTITPASTAGGAPTAFTVRLTNTGGVNGDEMNEATFTVPGGYTGIPTVAGGYTVTASGGKTWNVTPPAGSVGPQIVTVTAASAANDLTNGQFVDVAFTATTPGSTGLTTWNSGMKGAALGWYLDPTPATVDISVTDTTPPTTSLGTVPVAPDGDAGWFKTNPLTTLTSDEPGTTYYQWDSTASPVTYAAPFNAPQGTHTLYYWSADLSNNTETPANIQAYKTDTGLPTDPTSVTSPSHTTGTPSQNSNVVIDFSGATDTVSGVEGYSSSWSLGATATPNAVVDMLAGISTTTSPSLADGSWYFNIRTKDIAGNWTATANLGPFVVDTAPPTTGLSTSPTPANGNNGWFKGAAPLITLTPDEAGSTFYQWDSTSGAWTGYGGAFSALEDQHTLYYYSADLANNTETPALGQQFKVDTGAPNVSSTDPNSGAQDADNAGNVTATFDEDMFAATIDTTSFTLEDSTGLVSGVVTYDNPSKTAGFNPDADLAFETTYTATITTAVTDAAGNNLGTNYIWSFKTRNQAPVTSLVTAPLSADGNNGWFVTTPTITLTPDVSATTYYQWDATDSPSTYGAPISGIDGTHTLYYYSVDTFNNTETTKNQVIKTDTGDPIANIADPINGASINGTTYTISGTASDPATSGVAKVEVSIEYGAWELATGTNSWSWVWTLPGDGGYNIRARSTDEAGNVSYIGPGVNVTIINILVDNTPPTVVFTNPPDLGQNESTTTNVTARFNEEMTTATINGGTFTLANGGAVAGTVSYNQGTKTATFNPTSDLAFDTTYTATLTTGVQDLATNNLASNKVWTFKTRSQSTLSITLQATQVCDSCHSPLGGYDGVDSLAGSVGGKDNWATGVYDTSSTLAPGKAKWCVGCHDSVPSIINFAGTTMTAPPTGGDKFNYGAYVSGHNKDSGKYDKDAIDDYAGNDAAAQDCDGCHDFVSQHLSTQDDTDAAGQRILATINGQAISGSLYTACKACHQNAVGTQVSSHGNSAGDGYSSIEGGFGVVCMSCHEPHGSSLNASSSRNLKMVRRDVRIDSGGTTGDVDYRSTTGNNSLDESDAADGDDICATCHSNGSNPGSPMVRHDGGEHNTTDPASPFFGSSSSVTDKRGDNCVTCHKHDYKGNANVAFEDGFMPSMENPGGACGSGTCHNSTTQTVSTGSHQTHFTGVRSPDIASCDACHGVGSGNGSHANHFDGTVDFADGNNLSATNACNTCHSPAGGYNGVVSTGPSIGAKDNWTTGVYSSVTTLTAGKELWCAGCHDDAPSVIVVSGTTMTAPGTAGDGATYGAYINGHDTTSGTYDSGNSIANKQCQVCHALDTQHLNTVDDTDTTGQRIEGTIEGQSVTTVSDACDACHNDTGTAIEASPHGNSGEGYTAIEGAMSTVECASCHEPHGNNNNTASNRNLSMIRSDVLVTAGTTTPVVYESTTGANSLDEADGADADDLCAACHSNGSNPGSPMTQNDGGDHTTTVAGSIFYNAPGGIEDKRGDDCTICHRHDYKEDGNVAASNAFMPTFYPKLKDNVTDTCVSQACHAYTTGTKTSGSHTTHFDTVKGPGATTTCDTCHGAGAGANGGHAGHDNNVVNFADGTTTVLAATNSCNSCHSPSGGYNGVSGAAIGAKDNWTNGVYATTTTLTGGKEQWCVGCHDSAPPIIGGAAAPSVGGDAANYGAYISGHNKTSGQYDEAALSDAGGNVAANKDCAKCHNFGAQHLSGADDTDTAGQRILSTINGQAISVVSDACEACHQHETAGGDSASVDSRVSQHGNSQLGGYTPQVESTFTVESCGQCHDSHGNNLNTNSNRNLKMIKGPVIISGTTTGAVVFENRTGADSFDESDTVGTQDNDDICATCHTNAANPGNPVVQHVGGLHDGGGMGSDERGNDCASCHGHNYSGDTVTNIDDGFMPAGCSGCHGQPPVPSGTTINGDRKLEDYTNGGGAHVRHIEELGFLCKSCHPDPRPAAQGGTDSTTHNEGGGTFLPANVQVIIDATSYPQGTTENNGGTPIITKSTSVTAATCQIGCHNPKPFKPTSEPTSEGLSNAVDWLPDGGDPNNTKYLACGNCHDSQSKSIDSLTVQGVQYSSSHDRVDTTKRVDCLRCHYIEAELDHKGGTVTVRSAEATGTPIIWSANSTSTQETVCLSCHDADGMPAAWSFSQAGNSPANQETNWLANPAHRTKGGPSSNGLGCIGSAAINGTGCHSTPHGSAKRSLLAASNVAGDSSGSDEEGFCYGCHNVTDMPAKNAGKISSQMEYKFNDTAGTNQASVAGTTVNSASGNIFDASVVGMWFKIRVDGDYEYVQVTGWTASTLTLATNYNGSAGPASFYLRAKRITHPVGETVATHDSALESTATNNWNTGAGRHSECEDCHNPHGAQSGNSTTGTGELANVNQGSWGVIPTYSAIYQTGGANFTGASTAITGGTLDGGTPDWTTMPGGGNAIGWRIKHNYDKSGRWYTVTAVGGATNITISPAYDASYTDVDGMGVLVDYTMQKVTYTKTNTPTKEGELCLKCHSYFAYGTPTGPDSPPNTPSGMYINDNANVGVPITPMAVPETEVGLDFNPNQLAHHAVLDKGNNQPISPTGEVSSVSAINPNWPAFNTGTAAITTGGAVTFSSAIPSTVIPGWYLKWNDNAPVTGNQTDWYQVTAVNSATSVDVTPTPSVAKAASPFSLTAGLGNNFVPPYGPWSMITCTDCHNNRSNSNVSGPHGSNNKWKLAETTTSITFDWYFNGTVNTNVQPNNVTVGAGTAATATQRYFCFNCHRRDVYGDEGMTAADADNSSLGGVLTSSMARVQHNVSGPAAGDLDDRIYDQTSDLFPRWGNTGSGGSSNGDPLIDDGILCLQCHGGDSLGGLHGTSAKQGHLNNGGADTYVATPAGGDLRGERFLNGATWNGVTRATTGATLQCWTKADIDNVNTCDKGHSNDKTATKTANYDY